MDFEGARPAGRSDVLDEFADRDFYVPVPNGTPGSPAPLPWSGSAPFPRRGNRIGARPAGNQGVFKPKEENRSLNRTRKRNAGYSRTDGAGFRHRFGK